MRPCFLLTLTSFLFIQLAAAQNSDSIQVRALLKDISAAQVTETGYFYPGSFPSFRDCSGIPHNYQPDNNIFFTAIGIFTLRNLLPLLEGEEKQTMARIIENAQQAFPYYRNKQYLPFYNFWPTGKTILPRTLFIRHFHGLLGMGDDADDAVMVLMASGANDSMGNILKQRMIGVSNGQRKRIRSTLANYREYRAYSTYLGLQMPPDFDLGVHCNILYFMLQGHLPLVQQDTATIRLIAAMLKNRDYIRYPVFVSPYYARRPVILYHLARLIGNFHIPALDSFKTQLVYDIQQELVRVANMMDRILLSTSLMWLGQVPIPLNISNIHALKDSGTDRFIFFQARAAFWYPGLLKRIFLHLGYLRYNFYCPVFNKILLLEYLLVKRHIISA